MRKIYSIDVDCHLPSISFRLLDFPTQTVHMTDSERIAKIQDKIQENPDYVKDLGKLKNSKGDIIFNKGKSCLFPLSFESAQAQLSEIPLYVVLTENVTKSPKFLGSVGISLVKIMDKLKEEILRDSQTICNESIRGSYPIKNLMGTRIAKLAVEVKLYYYGSNLVNHIPALSNVVEKRHDTLLGSSDHLVSNEAISSVMEELVMEDQIDCKGSDVLNKTSELFSPEESDSEKEKDETETNLNPPPLFYQAVASPEVPKIDQQSKRVHIAKPKNRQTISSNRIRSKSGESDVGSETRLEKLIQFSQRQQAPLDTEPNSPMEVNEMMERGYDPKRFDLIRAVLTELTYLTDFLDPNLASNMDGASQEPLRQNQGKVLQHQSPAGPGHQKQFPLKTQKTKTPRRYGLTNSYILRLSKLGPDKALEVLSKHMGKQSASNIIDNRFNERHRPAKKSPIDRPTLKAQTQPILIDSECQTDQNQTTPATPKVAWQDESPISSQQRIGVPTGHGLTESFSQTLGGTAPFAVPQEGPTYSTPFQSSGSATMAQVLAAMQALAQNTMSQERDSHSRVSRHSSLRRANSNLDYNYSDNFEEPSCVSLVSPLSRPLSRAANSRMTSRSPVKTVPEDEISDEDISEDDFTTKPTLPSRSSRNMRYQRRSSSIKTFSQIEQDSSSTTSTAASTSIPLRRTKSSKSTSKKSQTSLGSLSTNQLSRRSHSSNSNMSTSKACQTPAPARSFSTQTNPVSDSEVSVQTVLPSPTRDLHSDHVISSHSSLESGSIYIGTDTDDEEEEDPLKLSYLLSTESVQFSDEDQPTSLLKLCSPSEARAVNKFMYTF